MNRPPILAPLLFLTWLLATQHPVQAQGVVADISESAVSISTGFLGTDLLLFGAIEPDTDVVVVVEGPPEVATVRRKDRVGGIWMNNDEIAFSDVPTFYAVLSNRPVDEFTSDVTREVYGIGVGDMTLKPLRLDDQKRGDLSVFRDALVRAKTFRGLYHKAERSVSIMWGRLFRTDLRIPVNAPVGSYWIRVFLFRDGQIVAAQTSVLGVDKVGLTAEIFDLAHRHSLAYGVLAVLVAAVAGWVANLAFRKH